MVAIKQVAVIGALAGIVVGAVVLWLLRACEDDWCFIFKWQSAGSVESFAECAARGFPVLESYPRQCRAGDRLFVEEIAPAADIRVAEPAPNAALSSPFVVSGEARGTWFFEASFPVRLLDGHGFTLGLAPAMAQGEWMTDAFVPFRLELPFAAPGTEQGVLVLERDNPSGLPEHDAAVSVPVLFREVPGVSGATMAVRVFLNDQQSASEPPYDCTKTVAVERRVSASQAVARAALEALLRGPTAGERTVGYGTTINPGVRINRLTIENGVAQADFDELLGHNVGGSCRVAAIRAQINETLRQFATIRDVAISINGRTEDILQP